MVYHVALECFSVLFDILRRVHIEQLLELFTEVLNIIDPYHARSFQYIIIGMDKKISGFPESDGPDKITGRLARHKLYLFIKTGM
jgi:hypothetical protein